MATTVFVNGSTLTDEGWFNDVDAITYDGTTAQILVGGGAGTIAAWTTATGSGSPVRGTSPSFTTSVVSASTTLAVFNTVATTVNAFGAASVALNMGHASGTNTILGASTFSQALTATSGIVLPSTAANITLGANYISYGGTDAGFSLDASNNATLSGALAITGALTGVTTLAASGTITSTASGTLFTRTGASTLQQQIIVGNTTGLMYLGVESSAGGAIATGTTAYATVLASETNTPVQIGVNGVLVGSFSSTGLSVTGTLGVTGDVSVGASSSLYAGGATTTPSSTHAGQAITNSGQIYNSAGATAADSVLNRFYNTNGLVGTIGTLNSGTYYNTSSDQRLKRDLGIATDTSVLRGVQIHDFEWIAGSILDRGVFAQEAHKVKPSAVSVGSDEVDEQGHLVKPWSADYSKFVPDLIVGWQDHESKLTAILEELTALKEKLWN